MDTISIPTRPITLTPSHWGIVSCNREIDPDIHPREKSVSLATYFTEKEASLGTFRGIGADYWGVFGFKGALDNEKTNFIKTYFQSSNNALKGNIFYLGLNNNPYSPSGMGVWTCENQERGSFVIIPNKKLEIINLEHKEISQETILALLAEDELKILNAKAAFYINENRFSIGSSLDSIR